MDPQVKGLHDVQGPKQLTPQKIISMLKITKKNDPLFKPLKKLKNALESIGYSKISLAPTKILIVFHFGLGNDLDYQFLKTTKTIKGQLNANPILPGKAYCYLKFQTQIDAEKYMTINFKEILQGVCCGYAELVYHNLSRTIICLYSNQTQENQLQQQLQLQDTPTVYVEQSIPGIKLIENFITKEQQLQLLQNIDKAEWQKLNNRRVQHYGYEFKYGSNQIDKQQKYQHPIPEFFAPLLQRLNHLDILKHSTFDQITVNDYFPGDGIPSHFDTHSPFQENFVALSMLSGLVMDWRKYDGTEKQVYLSPRSLIIFSGQGRYAWTHGITCRKIDKVDGQIKHRSRRISITLRQIKFTKCDCKYYFYCDSQGYDQGTMKKNNPLLLKYMSQNINYKKLQIPRQQIYKKFVLQAYNGFGFDFHNRAIQLIENMIKQYLVSKQVQVKQQQDETRLHQFTTILDVGCGNGQYKDVLQKIYKNPHKYEYIGIQICSTMKQFDNKILMDGLSLNFRPCTFDLVLCVAVLHHMTTHYQRLKMLKELHKVLSDEGIILLTVFSYEIKSKVYKDQDILLEYCVSKNKIGENIKNLELQHMRKQKRGIVFQRYYHLFKQQEIKNLLNQAQLQILDHQIDKQNHVIKAKKIKNQKKEEQYVKN